MEVETHRSREEAFDRRKHHGEADSLEQTTVTDPRYVALRWSNLKLLSLALSGKSVVVSEELR